MQSTAALTTTATRASPCACGSAPLSHPPVRPRTGRTKPGSARSNCGQARPTAATGSCTAATSGARRSSR